MRDYASKRRPGQVRDAILKVLSANSAPMSVKQIEQGVSGILGDGASSSVRSYLRLNTPDLFVRDGRGVYTMNALIGLSPELELSTSAPASAPYHWGKTQLYHADCFDWLQAREDESIHAVVTDPPYGLHEYTPEQQTKLRNGHGGVWRIPPSFDGSQRSPLPRFTVLNKKQLEDLRQFFYRWARVLHPKLVPGAHVIVASNPLLSYIVSDALAEAGLERRGEIVRLVMTMRGGDRPKDAHDEYREVSVMPRSMWEPWLVYRKPIEGRVQDNLRKWKTGGFRRPSEDRPFGDAIKSSPTRSCERGIAPHPSLKPQAFMRQIVRGVLPLGEGVVVDPFAGAGSTLAAAEALGYESLGVEQD
ncbi:site-specific DNA-methyltransferase, partial [bacterium]|nr:site-specific DNA-methyltransferase [bacterium]